MSILNFLFLFMYFSNIFDVVLFMQFLAGKERICCLLKRN